jgi:uncharacterized membrane protein (UPF0127 family)
MKDKKVMFISIFIILILIFAGYFFFFYQTQNREDSKALVSFHVSDSNALNFTCEVARTSKERTRGLMDRKELGEKEGMLFVYDTPQNVNFWMKDTPIPLDIIFILENLTVISVQEADVQLDVPDNELTRYESPAPVKWVVEINQGLSAFYGIEEGTKVDIYFPEAKL